MKENRVRRIWREGGVAYGAWISIPNAFSAKQIAQQGFDWVCVDMQHGWMDYSSALEMIAAIWSTDVTPFVRVPWNEQGIIGRVLDAGAMGVIIPMVNSKLEAVAAVNACYYHPLGRRSYGPTQVVALAGEDYFSRANQEVLCVPMIESAIALDNLDEILSIPGVDAVYLGPADLSITLGLPPALDNQDIAFHDAIRRVVKSCAEHGVMPGIHASASLAPHRKEIGYRMITVSGDISALSSGAESDLRRAKKGG